MSHKVTVAKVAEGVTQLLLEKVTCIECHAKFNKLKVALRKSEDLILRTYFSQGTGEI